MSDATLTPDIGLTATWLLLVWFLMIEKLNWI